MHSGKHLLASLACGAVLLYFLNLPILSKELLLIAAFGFLIDIDHLFNQMWKGNMFNPPKMVREWESTCDACTGELYIFHSYEFMAIIAVTSVFEPVMWFAVFSLVLHFLCDAAVNYRHTRTFEWLEDYSVLYMLYVMQDYPIFKRFFYYFKRAINPAVSIRLLIIYLAYAYTHPRTFASWFFVKTVPADVIRWLLDKL